LFASSRELMLAHMIDHYEHAAVADAPVFFDRGIPGLIGYCRLIGVPVPDHIRNAARAIATMTLSS
jgi:predicted ATPase